MIHKIIKQVKQMLKCQQKVIVHKIWTKMRIIMPITIVTIKIWKYQQHWIGVEPIVNTVTEKSTNNNNPKNDTQNNQTSETNMEVLISPESVHTKSVKKMRIIVLITIVTIKI